MPDTLASLWLHTVAEIPSCVLSVGKLERKLKHYFEV